MTSMLGDFSVRVSLASMQEHESKDQIGPKSTSEHVITN